MLSNALAPVLFYILLTLIQNCKQPAGSAGVDEQNIVRLTKRAFPSHFYESAESLAGVHGIKEQTFFFRHHAHAGG